MGDEELERQLANLERAGKLSEIAEIEKRAYYRASETLRENKRLPKIVLPAKKIPMFLNWWNEDIMKEKEIPHSFEEGYFIIKEFPFPDIKHFKKSITTNAKIYKTTYRDIETQLSTFLNDIKNVILHFKFTSDTNLKINGYKQQDKTQVLAINYTVGYEDGLLDEQTLQLSDDMFSDCILLNEITKKYSLYLGALLVTSLWYMATTAPSTRYIYEEKTPVITHRHKKIVHVSDTKFIVSQVYDLSKIRTTKVERLITRKKGWTYSHSFQVHGHYRHYKNGKVIFIDSYVKGKGKPFKAQTTILAPDKINM